MEKRLVAPHIQHCEGIYEEISLNITISNH